MRWHEVKHPTETLGGLAELYYGDWRLWRYIYDHNEDTILDPNHLIVGVHLCIPYHSRELPVPVMLGSEQ